MPRSRINTRAGFLCAVAATALVGLAGNAFAQAVLSATDEQVAANAARLLLVDVSGNLIGQISNDLSKNGVDTADNAGLVNVEVTTVTSVPAGVTMSTQAPKPTATPTKVVVKVKASLPVASCATSNVYNKSTGLCGDGKLPYKIVPLSAVSNPAAQVPNIACATPKVPTFSPATSKFACLVPTGFKISL